MPSKDGSQPATQAQLKAVRADLKTIEKSVRTDIQSVKSELKGGIQKLASQMIAGDARSDQKIENLRTEVRQGFDRVTGTIDAFLGRLETYARESVTLPKTLDAHGEKLRDHERRLTAVESK